LSDEEIEKAQAEAAQFAEEDEKKKGLVELKNKADAMSYQITKFLDEAKEQAEKNPDNAEAQLSDDDKSSLEALAKEAVELKDKEDVTMEELEKVTKEIEEKLNEMYQKY